MDTDMQSRHVSWVQEAIFAHMQGSATSGPGCPLIPLSQRYFPLTGGLKCVFLNKTVPEHSQALLFFLRDALMAYGSSWARG